MFVKKANFSSLDNKLKHSFCSYKKVRNTTILMLQQSQVPVTLDDKQQYLILDGILMTIKERLGEEKPVNRT
jgi:hypothetical protein